MVVADLHVHTTASDGSLSVVDLPRVASAVGLRAVAVTDHDRPHPDLAEPITDREGVTIIHGIELRVEAPSVGRFDVLGYGLRRTAALRRLVDRIQRNRIERAKAMVERVETHEGVDLDVEFEPGVGRPHVARAIATHPELDHSVQDAFDRLIGFDGPCFVPREVPSFDAGVDVLDESCQLVGLAHPLRYRDPVGIIGHARDLDAIERWYPYDRSVDHTPVIRAIRDHGLVPIGGSDAHDGRLGRAGLDDDPFRRFLRAGAFSHEGT